MAAYKEDYELSELEGRGGNGSPNPPIKDTDGLRPVENDDDGESEKGDELVESLRYTPEEERAVVKKLDRRLVLFVAFLYMLSFLDRSSKPASLTVREQQAELDRYRQCTDSWSGHRSQLELSAI